MPRKRDRDDYSCEVRRCGAARESLLLCPEKRKSIWSMPVSYLNGIAIGRSLCFFWKRVLGNFLVKLLKNSRIRDIIETIEKSLLIRHCFALEEL